MVVVEYNDWCILTLTSKGNNRSDEVDNSSEEVDESNRLVIDAEAAGYGELIEKGNFGAYETSDIDCDNFNIVQWDSAPYTSQENNSQEEMVVDALQWQFPGGCRSKHSKNWFVPTSEESRKVTVKLIHVLHPNVPMVAWDPSFYPLKGLWAPLVKEQVRETGRFLPEDVAETILDLITQRTSLGVMIMKDVDEVDVGEGDVVESEIGDDS